MTLTFGCVALAIFFILAGAMHFVVPELYAKIVPPIFPSPFAIVIASGIAEIAGGLGLLLPFTRRAAAWGLVLLLVCVFPANIYIVLAHIQLPGIMGKPWAQWLRLPLQIPLIWWAWRYTKRPVAL